MSLSTAAKAEIVAKHQRKNSDTGSSEVQISLLTARIRYLTEHFKVHTKDYHSLYGLRNLVNKRRKLLQYLKRNDSQKYRKLIEALELRDTY